MARTNCRQSGTATNHVHYDSFRIHIDHNRRTLLYMSINVNVNMKLFDLFGKKIVQKDNLKVVDRRTTFYM